MMSDNARNIEENFIQTNLKHKSNWHHLALVGNIDY